MRIKVLRFYLRVGSMNLNTLLSDYRNKPTYLSSSENFATQNEPIEISLSSTSTLPTPE